ncbi:MAG: hypothetical protein ACLFVU_12075 [Phycisphaerae bacterium]
MIRLRRLAITVMVVAMAVSAASAARQYKIEQDTGDGFDYAGNATAFTTNGTLSEFYGYKMDGPDNYGFTGPVPLTARQSHLFLVQASDGLGLFVVHNMQGAGGSGEAEMLLEFSDNDTWVAQEDDWDAHNWDEYDPDSGDGIIAEGGTIKAQWRWSNKTDGVAVGVDNPEHGDQILVQFADLSGVNADWDNGYQAHSGLDGWVVQNGDSSGSSIALMSLDGPVRLTLVPLPAAAWPAIGMLGVFAVGKYRSRRKATGN